MVIIEANVRGAERIATFQSKAAAFYFLKSISVWASVESIVTTSIRTKIKVSAEAGHLSSWSGALESARDYIESDQEFLFFTNYFDIYDYLKIKNDYVWGGPHSDEIKDEEKRRLDDFILSLDRKVIDIDAFDSCLNKVYLITTE